MKKRIVGIVVVQWAGAYLGGCGGLAIDGGSGEGPSALEEVGRVGPRVPEDSDGAQGGDAADDDERDDASRGPQAVLWLDVAEGPFGSCNMQERTALPDASAAATLAGADGRGSRLTEGVSCSVVPLEQERGEFSVRVSLSHPSFGRFEANGGLHERGSNRLTVEVATDAGSVDQSGCDAEVQALLPGAVWLRNLRCPALYASASPDVCSATGALIFENCERELR